MKHYTGTKTVKAAPMTMGEAYERKLLKEGVRPSECETDKAGYLVEYDGGYQSWSPADVFDKAYKPSETPLDRMYIEYDEEFDRYAKGAAFVIGQTFPKLNYLARVLLSAQNETQREYCHLLGDRINAMSNEPVILSNLNFGNAMSNEFVLLSNFDFGTALKLLKAGGAVRRVGWNGKGLFIVKQVPAHITEETIPGMQSLPQIAKDIIMSRDNPHIDYTNQMLIIHPDGRADSWVPSVSDVFAEDWQLVTE